MFYHSRMAHASSMSGTISIELIIHSFMRIGKHSEYRYFHVRIIYRYEAARDN